MSCASSTVTVSDGGLHGPHLPALLATRGCQGAKAGSGPGRCIPGATSLHSIRLSIRCVDYRRARGSAARRSPRANSARLIPLLSSVAMSEPNLSSGIRRHCGRASPRRAKFFKLREPCAAATTRKGGRGIAPNPRQTKQRRYS